MHLYWKLALLIIKLQFISGMNVKLSVEPASTFSGSLVTMKCKMIAEFGTIERLILRFPNNWKIRYATSSLFLVHSNGTSEKLKTTAGLYNASKSEQKTFPVSFINATHLSMVVKLKPTPDFSGNVNCSVKTAYDPETFTDGSSVSKIARLDVFWTPAVLSISLNPEPLKAGSNGIVSCEFRVSSMTQHKPKFSGVEKWSLTKSDPVQLNGHATKVSYKFTKYLLRADNGTQISCSIGNSSESSTLDIHYPPTVQLLPQKTTVFVGTLIRCEAIANPPVKATLKLSNLLESVSAKDTVEYKLPMTTTSGKYVASCAAEGNAIAEKTFHVKKLPLKVTLNVGKQPLRLDTQRRIICSSSDPDLQFLQIHFKYQDLIISMNNSDDFLLVKHGRNKTLIEVRTTPKRYFNVEVFKSLSKNKLEVNLTPKTFYDKTTVDCVAKSAPSVGKEGRSRNETLAVHWDPAVRSVTVVNSSNGTDLSDNQNVTVRCEVQFGNPKSTVEAFIGQRRLENHFNPQVIEKSMWMEWYEIAWHAKISREDDRRKVICRFDEKTLKTKQLRVRFAPRLVDIIIRPQRAEVLPGDRVTCSAKGFPLPRLLLSIEPSTRGSEQKGIGSVTMAVPVREAGNVTFACKAGGVVRKAVKIVGVQKQRESKMSLLVVIGPILILLIVIFVGSWICYTRKNGRSSRSSSSKRGGLRLKMSFSREDKNAAALQISLQSSRSKETKESTSTTNDASNTSLISNKDNAELTYAVLDFDNVPTSSRDADQNSEIKPLTAKEGDTIFGVCNKLDEDEDEDVVYSELAPCQDLPNSYTHVCNTDNDNDYEEVMCPLP